MLGSLIKAFVKYGSILVGLFIISFIPSLVVCQILRLNPNMITAQKSLALLLSGIMFAIGWLIFFKKHDFSYTKYPMAIAVIIPPILLLVSFATTPIALSFETWVLIFIGIGLFVTTLWYSADWLRSKTNGGLRVPSILVPSSGTGNLVGAIEVKEIPDAFVADREASWEPEKVAQSTLNIIRSMITARIPYGLRIERISRINKLVFLTHANNPIALNNHLDHLQSTIRAYYTGFLVERVGIFKPPDVSSTHRFVSAQMMGEPMVFDGMNQSLDGLTSTIETLLTMTNGIVQVFVAPAGSNALKRRSLRKSFEKEMEKSQTTVARSITSMFKSEHSETQTQVNVLSSAKARKLGRELARHEAESPCNVGLYVTCWDASEKIAEQNARMLINSMSGSFTPADHTANFNNRILKHKNDSEKLVKGHPVGKFTFLLIDEAAVFFVPPRNEMGLKTSRRESFSTAVREPIADPFSETDTSQPVLIQARTPGQRSTQYDPRWFKVKNQRDLVILGFLLRANGERLQGELNWFAPTELQSHLGIFGNTRSGKTTTAISVISQLIQFGIFPIIFVPAKNHEWRILKTLYPDLRIFSAGNPNAFSLKLNMWRPPKGVLISTWIERLNDVFHAWFPNEAVLSMLFRKVIYATYRLCGWSTKTEKYGRPILLTDFYQASKDIGSTLEYGSEIRKTFYGALVERIGNMLLNPSIVEMYNTPGGITYEELFQHPVIIELDSLPPKDSTILTGLLTAGLSEYRQKNSLTEVANVLVIEEAHKILKKVGSQNSESRTPQQEAVSNVTDMLRVAGGIGLGVIILDQAPSLLATEALKLTSNLIIHSRLDTEDRELVGKRARCSAGQIEHLGGMRVGETVVFLEKENLPKNVEIAPLGKFLAVQLPRDAWPDKKLQEQMQLLFKEREDWISIDVPEDYTRSVKKEILLEKERAKQVEAEVESGNIVEKLRPLVDTESYKEMVKVALDNLSTKGMGPLKDVINSVLDIVKLDGPKKKAALSTVVILTKECHGLPEDDAILSKLISEIQEEVPA